MSNTFYPPERLLMGPGPSNVSPRVLSALGRPTIGHLDIAFIALMDDIRSLLQYAFNTHNDLTLPISGPGSAGMEACFVNLVEPGDKVIICKNGVFGQRMQENVERCGGNPILVEDDWGQAVDPEKLETALKTHNDVKIVAFVHAETSTGVLSDAKVICDIAKSYGCLTIVDAVTSLGGSPLYIDDWHIDACYSGTQKCLSCVPGISPVTFSKEAVNQIKTRSSKIQSWFLDMTLIMSYWGEGEKRAYHHTAPVNSLYALHESLVILKEEALENAWQRHDANHDLLKNALNKIGLTLAVPEDIRLPQLNAVNIPNGVDDESIRKTLLGEHNIEIGAGLGTLAGKIWRIGLMGYSSNPQNIARCATALDAVLNQN